MTCYDFQCTCTCFSHHFALNSNDSFTSLLMGFLDALVFGRWMTCGLVDVAPKRLQSFVAFPESLRTTGCWIIFYEYLGSIKPHL